MNTISQSTHLTSGSLIFPQIDQSDDSYSEGYCSPGGEFGLNDRSSVAGTVSGRKALVGKEKFIEEAGVKIAQELRSKALGLQANARTVVFFALACS
jgi:hypothetical protein